LVTYIGPLVFILSVTISKEAYDDLLRKKRDNVNNTNKFFINSKYYYHLLIVKITC